MLNAVQEQTADGYQARVVGLLESVSSAMPGLGFVIGGALATAFDPRVTFAAAGLGVVVVLAAAAFALRSVPWGDPSMAPADAATTG